MNRSQQPQALKTFNPYVFVVGCPRSGTTLLRRLLDSHPDLAITPETHFIPRFFKQRIGISGDGTVTPQLVTALLEHRRFHRLRIDREQLESLLDSERVVRYSTFVSKLFDLYGTRKGKRLVGDKTPGYARNIPTLHHLWPGAKFVHLIRDGRDVCLSVTNWSKAERNPGIFTTWNEDRISTAALWWERFVQAGREDGRVLGPDLYYELHYEALIARPAEECAALCEFLGVPFYEQVLRFHEGRSRANPGLTSNAAWLPITRGLRDWRTQMRPEDIERFEASVGELLEELGYARRYSSIRTEVLEHARSIRDGFARDIRRGDSPSLREYDRGALTAD
jgi:hypothetical protein